MPERSLMEELARLPLEVREEILAGMDMDALLWDWKSWARPSQIPPEFDWAVTLFLAGRGAGKALSDDTPIPTPSGWTAISDLKVGDTVFDHAGAPTRVTAVYSQGMQPSARVVFRDGSTLVAALDHEWTVVRGKTLSWLQRDIDVRDRDAMRAWPSWRRLPKTYTFEMAHWRNGAIYAATRTSTPSNTSAITVNTDDLSTQDHVPLCGTLQLPDRELPVDPWVFGMWLGDGDTGGGSICAAVDDADHLARQLVERGYVYEQRIDPRNGLIGFKIPRLHEELKTLGLAPRRDMKKRVPREFFRGSPRQRLELLQGLMDSDGHAGTLGRQSRIVGVGFVNEELRDAVDELATSLGYMTWRRVKTLKATALRPERQFFGVDFRADRHMNPFTLPRKRDRVTDLPKNQAARKRLRHVASVEPVGELPVTCIAVEAESHLFLAGRAMIPTHNTRSASEWIREKAKYTKYGPLKFLLVARTSADTRDVMIEGESGIMNVTPPSEMPLYQPSIRRITWPNGNIATVFSADEPDQLRGPNAHYSWADEMAAWRQIPDSAGMSAWDNLRIATRLGEQPQIYVTTTPKRVPQLKALIKEAEQFPRRVIIQRGKTTDNMGNLSTAYIEAITGIYAGTRLARQELDGEMLDDVEGALWTQDMIDAHRASSTMVGLPIKLVGVDPSVAENPKDECGIVVIGCTAERELWKRQAWILEDVTVHGSPDVWSRAVVAASQRWGAPVVAEVNQGGALVRGALAQHDATIRVIDVHSKVGKALRAEPVVLAYEQGRVHHLGILAELEAQMTSWVPGETRDSPDRCDALVHALTAAMIKPPPGLGGGQLVARATAAQRTVPSTRALGTTRGNRGGRVFSTDTTRRR